MVLSFKTRTGQNSTYFTSAQRFAILRKKLPITWTFLQVDILSRVHHKHLVALVGYCRAEEKQMLIYEYIHKGSLRDHLDGMFLHILSFFSLVLFSFWPTHSMFIANSGNMKFDLIWIIFLQYNSDGHFKTKNPSWTLLGPWSPNWVSWFLQFWGHLGTSFSSGFVYFWPAHSTLFTYSDDTWFSLIWI